MRALAEKAADQQIGEALDALIAKRDDLRRWIENAAPVAEAGNLDDVLADLRGRLGLDPVETEDSVCRAMCDAPNWSREACRKHRAMLSGATNASDRDAVTALDAILGAEGHAREAGARLAFFFTGTSELKVRAVSR